MVGQIVNVLSGCVATILNMAGFEKKTCMAFYIALAISIILGIILTLEYGIYGLCNSLKFIYDILECVFTGVQSGYNNKNKSYYLYI